MELISKHIDKNNLKLKIYNNIFCICAFTGKIIKEGVLMRELIKDTFTDHQFIKYSSQYASVEIALLIESVIPTDKGFNSLRNYSFYADNFELKLLRRECILELLLNIRNCPFQIAITYSNKKHIAFKAPINYNKKNYQIITDLGLVNFEKNKALEILDIAQKWYTVPPESSENSSLPTFFTKEQIKGITTATTKQINRYGAKKYFFESQQLSNYRGTSLFNLIIHLLNKNKNEN